VHGTGVKFVIWADFTTKEVSDRVALVRHPEDNDSIDSPRHILLGKQRALRGAFAQDPVTYAAWRGKRASSERSPRQVSCDLIPFGPAIVNLRIAFSSDIELMIAVRRPAVMPSLGRSPHFEATAARLASAFAMGVSRALLCPRAR